MLTQDILLDLVVVLGLAVVLGPSCYTCCIREACELWSRRERRE